MEERMSWKISNRKGELIKSGFESPEEAVDYLIDRFGEVELSSGKFVIFEDLDEK
jgi:hypothetical protein